MKIDQLCTFRYMPQAMTQRILELDHGILLLNNVTSLQVQCQSHSYVQPGCQFCLMHLKCHCSLAAPPYSLPPRIENCKHHGNDSTILYPVNLALMHSFFSHEELHDIASDSMYEIPPHVDVPKFKFSSHKFSKLSHQNAHLQLDL